MTETANGQNLWESLGVTGVEKAGTEEYDLQMYKMAVSNGTRSTRCLYFIMSRRTPTHRLTPAALPLGKGSAPVHDP